MRPSIDRAAMLLRASLIGSFVGWSLLRIWKSSFVASDGRRYFTALDDALISMRYAWNVAQGHGAVFNPGERVEGYTNLLQMLLGACVAWVTDDRRLAVLGISLLGVLIMVGVGWATAGIARVLLRGTSIEPWAWPIGFAAGVSFYPLTVLTLEGMETGLLTLCFSVALLLALREDESERRGWWIGLLLGLAFLSRPDGGLFAPWILGYLWFGGARGRGAALRGALVFVVTVILVSLARYGYYGQWVPNTFVMKVQGNPFDARLRTGVLYGLAFFPVAGPLFAIALLDLIVRRTPRQFLCFGIPLSLVAYVVWAGGDIWQEFQLWRFPAPAMPLLTLLVVGAAARLSHRRSKPIALAAFVACILWLNLHHFSEALLFRDLPLGDAQQLTERALAMDELLEPEARIAVAHAGTVPYFTGRYAIDLLGKTDPHVARSEARTRGDGTYAVGHNKVDLRHSLMTLRADTTERVVLSQQSLDVVVPDHRFREYEFRGHTLWLREGSPNVRWELLAGDRTSGRQTRERQNPRETETGSHE